MFHDLAIDVGKVSSPKNWCLKKTRASYHHKALFSWISPKKKHEKNHPTRFHPKIMKVYLKNLSVQTVSRNSTWIFQGKIPGIKTVENKKSWGFVMSLDVVGRDNFRDCASVTTKFRLTPPEEKVFKKLRKFNKIHNPFNPLDMISSKCQFHMARKTPRMWTKISTSVLGNGAEG